MGKLKLNTSELNKAVDELCASGIEQYKEVGKKAMKELREEATISWFGKFGANSDTLLHANKYLVKKVDNQSKKYVIHFHSYTDADLYSTYKNSAVEWNKRYKGVIDMPMSPAEYILDLQYNKGIIGLPKESVARTKLSKGSFGYMSSAWVNPKFYLNSTILKSYVEQELENNWDSAIKKAINKK